MAPLAVVTGAGGLVGSEAVAYLIEAGFDVIGVDNDMRGRLFGPAASVEPQLRRLRATYPDLMVLDHDVRDAAAMSDVFEEAGPRLELVVHAAAQPSHDWAASDPLTDFTINANGTLNLLQATRAHCPEATFAFISTNKVYGDRPNALPLVELETRLDLLPEHEYHAGIPASMSIDRSLHSLFGASKISADLLVQEYGRYFGIPTVCFRAGCVSGPNHSGVEQHGFLSYLMRCVLTETRYTVYGHGGKQVRDNLHARDLVRAIGVFHRSPRVAAVYNIGGGRGSNCSVLEAIETSERIAGRRLDRTYNAEPRIGDHRWWISDLAEFRRDYPDWEPEYGIDEILRECHDRNAERWTPASVSAG
jgi:CDP-paratose 2-epimerase